MNPLTDLFTNIANAIRTKTGSAATITASNFPTEIADNIPGRSNNECKGPLTLSELSSIRRYLGKIGNMIVPSGTTSLSSYFKDCIYLEEVKISDISGITNMNSIFSRLFRLNDSIAT